ncbi:MAG: universal stress protein, partial [Humibacillus sp.]
MQTVSSQPIAVGVDGSAASCAAVDWAALAAERHGLPLTITTVLDYPGPWTGLTAPEAPVPAELTARAQHLVETAGYRAVKVLPESQVTTSVVQGPPAAVLRSLSESAAMLVLGNRRHNELGALSARSVTFALAAHAQGPLVLVPDTEAGGGGGVVVGVDGSASAGRALDRAADEATALGVGLT